MNRLSFLFVLHFILTCCTCYKNIKNQYPPYPIYTAVGTPYEVGYSLGYQTKDRINQFLKLNSDDIAKCESYISSALGKSRFESLVSFNKRLYPTYFDELIGIANGSNIDFTKILILNLEYELDALMTFDNFTTQNKGVKHCTDIFIYNMNNTHPDSDNSYSESNMIGTTDDNEANINTNFVGFGHNEDDGSSAEQTGFLANITYILEDNNYDNNNNKTQNIFGLVSIPGLLIGTSFAVSITNHMALSVNALFPERVDPNGRAIIFVGHSLLFCDYGDVDCVKNILNSDETEQHQCVGGSYNIGFTCGGSGSETGAGNGCVENESDEEGFVMMNVESNYNQSSYNVVTNEMNYDYHFNEYLRLNISQYDDVSSDKRLNRTKQLIQSKYNSVLTNYSELVDILGDTKNGPYYSIYNQYTMLTGIADLINGTAHFYSNCNPSLCQPTVVVKF